MNDKSRRTARLERLMRVREVARLTALERVTGAEQAFTRLSGIARRSNALAADYASRPDVLDAASLQNLRAYHSGITHLSADAARNTMAARQAADAEQVLLARAERSRDLVEKRLSADRLAAAKAKTAAMIAAQAHLARSLNSKR